MASLVHICTRWLHTWVFLCILSSNILAGPLYDGTAASGPATSAMTRTAHVARHVVGGPRRGLCPVGTSGTNFLAAV